GGGGGACWGGGGGGTHSGATLSEAGAGAYGEMCAVANDVGQPELIYSFLTLASHHSAWTTRRGASFGLGAIISQAAAGALEPQLHRIVPRLYRYRFDPSAKTRAAMDQLWCSVVGGGSTSGGAEGEGGNLPSREKEIINTHFGAIMTELLRGLGDRKWHNRQASCSALAKILVGRGWDEVGPHLEKLWTMADRAIDDIKESVAEAGIGFAKTLANVSIRLSDPYSSVVTAGNSGNGASGDAPTDDDGREEASEVRRTVGNMLEDLRISEAEAAGEEGDGQVEGALGTGAGRAATVAAAEAALQLAHDAGSRQGVGGGGEGQRLGGPSVIEVLRQGRGEGRRTVGRGARGGVMAEPSLAAIEVARATVSVVLPWLLQKGILSRCKVSQALSMRTLTRLVKVCGREALMPHVAELVATLIEGMSALEPQALQYMQFHAETQLDMTQEQMERLRLSASRAGPLQEALDHCLQYLEDGGSGSSAAVEALIPRLLGLLRAGTGLATRSASTRLVLSLCERCPGEVRRAAPKLLPVLTNAALSEPSATLRRSYSGALSTVARLTPAPRIARLAARLCNMFREADPALDQRQRRTLALLLGDLCRRAGGQLEGRDDGETVDRNAFEASGWAQVLPLAFVARHDPDNPVAKAFKEVWEEGLTQLQLGAAGAGETLLLSEVMSSVSGTSRVTKRQGCAGAKDLAVTLGPLLGQSTLGRCLTRLMLSLIPGRAWEGKEELLEAVVAVCVA
ncbi:unnamed protein product, partial [Choristocarpus tenellus]